MATYNSNFDDFVIDLNQSVTKWDRSILMRRAVWEYLFKPIFMALPRRANKMRIGILRLMGAKIGTKCLVEPRVDVLMPWNLVMADMVAVGRQVEIYNYATVTIGPMTVISQYSYLCTGTHDYSHPHMPLTWAPIEIGAECWLAARVFVAPGVNIGRGVVVGACSVVSKQLPDWTVCAGNPCKELKKRIVKSA